jgi:hypothetical protein
MNTSELANSWEELIKCKKKNIHQGSTIGVDTQDICTLGLIHDTLSYTHQVEHQHQK